MQTVSPTIYSQRLSLLRAAMIDSGVSLALINPGANMCYLAGYSEEGHERLICLAVPIDGAPTLLVPAINRQGAAANKAGIADVRVWTDADGWRAVLEELIANGHLAGETIAVDDDMPARFVVPIGDIAIGERIALAGSLLAPLRSVKDAAEIAALRRAAQITEDALIAGRMVCEPGATEQDIAAAIDAAFRASGAAPSFESIVAVGANAALPHHMPGDTTVSEGDIVLFDIGALIDDYRGDITRVFSVGQPSPEARAVYEIVYHAYTAAFDTASQAGATGADVDAAARSIIAVAGYGEQFIHRTGHGLGLDAHEEPNMSANNHEPLASGNCFSIEPGIYLPGQFGVRLENIAIVADNGVESLNSPIPPELQDVANL